jgi:hypothetical protein
LGRARPIDFTSLAMAVSFAGSAKNARFGFALTNIFNLVSSLSMK